MSLVGQESGCKVGWEFYDNEAEAVTASERAARDRDRMFAQGYDFGYLWPGTILHLPDQAEYGECWRVVTP